MKSKNVMLTLIICASIIRSNAQTMNDRVNVPLSAINTVVVNNLSGVCTIYRSKTNELTAKSELHISGSRWGWSFPNERPPFKISSRQSKDTLFVEMPIEISFKTIGISTYDEQIKSVLQIPESKHIIVRNANKLIIEDEFSYLNIQNTSFLECSSINKNSMSIILCDAIEGLIINGLKSYNQYEFQGTGKGYANIKATNISLTLK